LNDANCDKHETKGLVVFDVEGVLFPKRRYIPFEATKKLGFLKFLKIVFFGFLYEIGFLTLETALKRIFKCFEGYTIEELHYYYTKVPLIPNSEKVFEQLRKNGWKTALISSGLPNLFVQELATKLKADYAFGLELKTISGKLTGEIEGEVIRRNGKATILKGILQREQISPQDCVLVADDRNNLQIFPYAGLKIGYNPDFILSAKSDHVVSGSLKGILPVITKAKSQQTKLNLSRNQIIRGAIHISGFAVPFLCTYLLNGYLIAFLIFLVTIIYILSEFARMAGMTVPIFSLVTSKAAVKLESYEFAVAPIFYALGIILSIIVFPPYIGYPSIAILTLGDGFASLFGRKFGKASYSFNKAKNFEGSLFGFIFAFVGATFFLDPIRALVGAVVGMFVECLPMPLNDNLAIPLTSGFVLSIAFI
jgi:phosphoserine phosphatase/dolichol kinase